LSIVDAKVFDRNNENVALPKNDFADYVLNQVENFAAFDVSEFGKIFDVIVEIVSEYQRQFVQAQGNC
jgi:RNA-directed DNA polymerase